MLLTCRSACQEAEQVENFLQRQTAKQLTEEQNLFSMQQAEALELEKTIGVDRDELRRRRADDMLR
jgi:hypothetical protein